MEFGYFAAAFICLLIIIDIRNHNKKVDEYFPEDYSCDNRKNNHYRRNLTVSLGQFYLLMFILVLFFVRSIFKS